MQLIYKKITPSSGGLRVAKITIAIVVNDVVGKVKITDVMLQGGDNVTAWNGHPSEVRWTLNE